MQLHEGPSDPVFSSVDAWVTFSDLHVSHKSLDVCMEVLRRVHEEARKRGAGVLFLGECAVAFAAASVLASMLAAAACRSADYSLIKLQQQQLHSQ